MRTMWDFEFNENCTINIGKKFRVPNFCRRKGVKRGVRSVVKNFVSEVTLNSQVVNGTGLVLRGARQVVM